MSGEMALDRGLNSHDRSLDGLSRSLDKRKLIWDAFRDLYPVSEPWDDWVKYRLALKAKGHLPDNDHESTPTPRVDEDGPHWRVVFPAPEELRLVCTNRMILTERFWNDPEEHQPWMSELVAWACSLVDESAVLMDGDWIHYRRVARYTLTHIAYCARNDTVSIGVNTLYDTEKIITIHLQSWLRARNILRADAARKIMLWHGVIDTDVGPMVIEMDPKKTGTEAIEQWLAVMADRLRENGFVICQNADGSFRQPIYSADDKPVLALRVAGNLTKLKPGTKTRERVVGVAHLLARHGEATARQLYESVWHHKVPKGSGRRSEFKASPYIGTVWKMRTAGSGEIIGGEKIRLGTTVFSLLPTARHALKMLGIETNEVYSESE